MGKLLKLIIVIGVIGGCMFWGKPLWEYATNVLGPKINCACMCENPHFRGQSECAVSIKSVCKLTELQVFIDEKPFDIDISGFLGKKAVVIDLTFDSTKYSDGLHEFKVIAVDGGYNLSKACVKWPFHVDNLPLRAEMVKSEFCVQQGRTVHVTIQANKKIAYSSEVTFSGRKYKLAQAEPMSNINECFIPVDCEAKPGSVALEVSVVDDVGNTTNIAGTVKVVAANFSRYANLSISSSKLADERENSVSSSVLESALAKWTESSSKSKLWSGIFDVPTIVQRYSTPFGEIRTTAEKGRYIHKAVDIVNLPRKVVWASQAGKVIIKERFMMTGNTVAIDHGMGILTLYCHLDDFADIDVGDMLKKGNPVGKIGKTGYATGYHLHWELRVNNVAVDPLQWTQRTF